MKRIHLLRVEPSSDIESFRSLIDAVRADGGRVGWLRWRPVTPSRDETLIEAAAESLLRHVDVDASGSVARKPRSGPAVLRDVVREHFRGCRAVLVAGEGVGELAEIAGLAESDDGFRIEWDESVRELSAEDLAARLRRPRPV